MRISTPYVAVRTVLANKSVVDIGGGPGYGSLLAAQAHPASYVTCDVEFGRLPPPDFRAALGTSVSAVQMDAEALGIGSGTADLVIMFEVIEHVRDPDRVLREVRRVLRPGGLLLASTPNRSTRLLRFERPWNPEHLREYHRSGYEELLRRHFGAVQLLGIYGSSPWNDRIRAKWQPSYRRWYRTEIRPRLARVLPEAALRAIGRSASLGRSSHVPPRSADVLNEEVVPAGLDPRGWPFFVGGDGRESLSMFSVAGDDEDLVGTTARDVAAVFGNRRLPSEN